MFLPTNKEPVAFNNQQFSPEPGYLDTFKEAVGLGFSTGTLSSIGRMIDYSKKQDLGPKLTPEEIRNKGYKLEVQPREPITEETARWQEEQYKEKIRKQQILAAAPNNFFGKTIVPFAGQMAGAMLDPIDLSAGIALGAGTGYALKAAHAAKVLSAAKISKDLVVPGISKVAKFGIDAAETALAVGVTETFAVNAAEKAGLEYTAEDALKNVFFASLGFTGALHGGSYLISKAMKLGDGAIGNMFRKFELDKDNGIRTTFDELELSMKKLEVDEASTSLVNSIFGKDLGESILKDAEFKRDIGKNIENKVRAGELTPEQAHDFLQKVDDAGLDKELFNPELNNIPLDEATRKAMGDQLDSPQKMEGIDYEAYKEVAEAAERSTPERVMTEYEQIADAKIKEYDKMAQEGTLKNEDIEYVEAERTQIAKEKQELDTATKMKECLNG